MVHFPSMDPYVANTRQQRGTLTVFFTVSKKSLIIAAVTVSRNGDIGLVVSR